MKENLTNLHVLRQVSAEECETQKEKSWSDKLTTKNHFSYRASFDIAAHLTSRDKPARRSIAVDEGKYLKHCRIIIRRTTFPGS